MKSYFVSINFIFPSPNQPKKNVEMPKQKKNVNSDEECIKFIYLSLCRLIIKIICARKFKTHSEKSFYIANENKILHEKENFAYIRGISF